MLYVRKSMSPTDTKIFCIPGNAGTSKIAENVKINILDFKKY